MRLIPSVLAFLLAFRSASFAGDPTVLYPPALEPGDGISVIAPASPLNRERVERAVARLEEMGFKVKLPQNLEAVLDLAQPLVTAKPKALNVAELHALYKDTDVPAHRFLFAEVQNLISKPELAESLMVTGFEGLLPELDIDALEVMEQLLETEGDTSYEELKCVGLN